MRLPVFLSLALVALPAAAAADDFTPVTTATWKANAGLTANLTEGNSSTRLFGAVLSVNREGPVNFLDGVANGQYGITRTPSKLANPDGATDAERAGSPGKWKFDENINNFLAQTKYGHYVDRGQRNYLYALFRFEGNRFAGYWQRYETQAGYGRRLTPFETLALKLEVGPDFTEDHLVVHRIRSRVAAAGTLQAAWKLGATSTLNEEVTHLRTIASNDPAATRWLDHRTRSTTTLVVQVTERFHLQSGVTFDYASKPAPGAHPLDVAVTNAFLYSFP